MVFLKITWCFQKLFGVFKSYSPEALRTACCFQKLFGVFKSYLLFPKVTRRRRCVPHDVYKSYSPEALRSACCFQKLLVVSKSHLEFPKVIWCFQKLFGVFKSYSLEAEALRTVCCSQKLLAGDVTYRMMFKKCTIDYFQLIYYYNELL